MTQNIDAASQKEMKILFLTIMKEFIEHSEKMYLETYVPSLIIKLQTLLDSIQDYDILRIILDSIKYLSISFPDLFSNLFQDLIDLLIGWRLDDNLPDQLAKIINDIFKCHVNLWSKNSDFGIEMLERFLTDMNSIISHVYINNSKLYRFLNLTNNIYSNLLFSNNSYLSKLLNLFNIIASKIYDNLALNEIRNIMLAIYSKNRGLYKDILTVASKMLSRSKSVSTTKDLLDFHSKLTADSMSPSILGLFLASEFGTLRYHSSSQVISSLMQTLRDLLNSQQYKVEYLEYYINEIQYNMDYLLKHYLNKNSLNTLSDSNNNLVSSQQCLDYISFNCILLCTVKDSNLCTIILDNVYNIYLEYNSTVLLLFPQCIISILKLTRSIYLILDVSNSDKFGDLLLYSLSIKHSKDVIYFALLWIESLVNGSNISVIQCKKEDLVNKLLLLLNTSDIKSCKLIFTILEIIITSGIVNNHLIHSIVYFATLKMMDTRKLIQERSLEFLLKISPLLFTESFTLTNLTHSDNTTLDIYWKNQYRLLLVNNILLKSHQFSHFIGLLSHKAENSTSNSNDWMISLFLSFKKDWPLFSNNDNNATNQQLQQQGINTPSVPDFISTNESLCMIWMCWEAAKYCIASRLRTPIGNPVQTFEFIESLLSQLDTSIQYKMNTKMLLLFVDHLEKQIHLSFEGNQLILSNNSALHSSFRNSCLFFRANRKVCEDWYHRMRPLLVASSVVIQSPLDIIRNSMKRLEDLKHLIDNGLVKDIKKLVIECENLIYYLCKSLSDIKEPDTIQGVLYWIEHTLLVSLGKIGIQPSIFTLWTRWITSFIYVSKGYYEITIQQIKPLLQIKDLNNLNPTILSYLIRQMFDCYIALRDWNGIEEWLAKYREIQDKYKESDISSAINVPFDLSIIQCLSKFDANLMKESAEIANKIDLSTMKLYQNDLLMLKSIASNNNAKKSEYMYLTRAILEDPLKISTNFGAYYEWNSLMLQLASINYEDKDVQNNINSKLDKLSTDIRYYLKLFSARKHTIAHNNNSFTPLLIDLSRKQFNFQLCETLINREISKGIEQDYYNAMLLNSKNKPSEAIQKLIEITHSFSTSQDSNLKSQVYLKLARLLIKNKNKTKTSNVDNESIIKYLKLSTDTNPLMAKSWYHYGEWLYKQGHKSFMTTPSSTTLSIDNTLPRSSGELHKYCILSSNDYLILSSLLSSYVDIHNLSIEDQSLLVDQFDSEIFQLLLESEEFYDTIDYQIQKEQTINILSNLCKWSTSQFIEDFLDIWHKVRNRLIQPYEIAINSYYNYLKTVSSAVTDSNHFTMLVSILKIFRILVKYGSNPTIQKQIELCLHTIPTQLWKDLVPQLFSRLNHSNNFVRSSLIDVIKKIATEYPHFIVYPTVVALNSSTSSLNNNNNSSNSIASNSIHYIRDIVSSLHSNLYNEVLFLIKELSRITVLWEEQSLNTLQHILHDLSSKIKMLKTELVKIQQEEDKLTIFKDKLTNSVVKPSLTMLRKLLSIITSTPKSHHEKWFQATYLEVFQNLENLLNLTPEDITVNLEGLLLTPIKELINEFSIYVKPCTLPFYDLVNSNMKNFEFKETPIPGIDSSASSLITVSTFDPTISILPTKTKPKKFKIIGSNGSKYTYLLKGSEDLHLDERLMQLFNVINQMLLSDTHCRFRSLRCRTYAVIPLSEKSGLIQWVDNSMPLFNLFKHYQRRDHQVKLMISKATNSNAAVPDISRPSDLFYSKILPALKERGITSISSRTQWPLDILKTVFEELIKETPCNLISNEIWSKSISVEDWWKRNQSFITSNAVMSMVGYIIGLGDRHLDNILLDTNTSEIIHIDYNICFERGLKLRVPEKVPFRCTQNIQHALGLAGTDGKFKLSSLHTMRVLRKNKNILLSLLETFVYDPLVDWTADHKSDDSKHKLQELQDNLTLYNSRYDDCKDLLVMLLEKYNTLNLDYLNTLKLTITNKSYYNQYLTNQQTSGDDLKQIKNQLSILEDQNTSTLNTLKDSSDKLTILNTSRDNTIQSLYEINTDLLVWQSHHSKLLDDLKSGSIISDMFVNIDLDIQIDSNVDLNTQNQMNLLKDKKNTIVSQCTQYLKQYQSVLQLLPVEYSQMNMNYYWHSAICKVTEDTSNLDLIRYFITHNYQDIFSSYFTTISSHIIDEKQEQIIKYSWINQISSIENKYDIPMRDTLLQNIKETSSSISGYLADLRTLDSICTKQKLKNNLRQVIQRISNLDQLLISIIDFESSKSLKEEEEEASSLPSKVLVLFKTLDTIILDITNTSQLISSCTIQSSTIANKKKELIEKQKELQNTSLSSNIKKYLSLLTEDDSKLKEHKDKINISLNEIQSLFVELHNLLDLIYKLSIQFDNLTQIHRYAKGILNNYQKLVSRLQISLAINPIQDPLLKLEDSYNSISKQSILIALIPKQLSELNQLSVQHIARLKKLDLAKEVAEKEEQEEMDNNYSSSQLSPNNNNTNTAKDKTQERKDITTLSLESSDNSGTSTSLDSQQESLSITEETDKYLQSQLSVTTTCKIHFFKKKLIILIRCS